MHSIRPLSSKPHTDQVIKDCWLEMAASMGDFVLPVRDPAFFRQRYAAHPLFHYEPLLVSNRWTREPLGIAVVRRHDEHVELLDLIGAKNHLPQLISAARRFSARIGQKTLKAWFSDAAIPLVQTPDCSQTETGITIPIAREAAFAEASRNHWFLMAGDCDFH